MSSISEECESDDAEGEVGKVLNSTDEKLGTKVIRLQATALSCTRTVKKDKVQKKAVPLKSQKPKNPQLLQLSRNML